MSDHISRAKLFDKLATVNGEDANDMKAKIYAVIQEMETEPDLSGDWVELHDHISKNMEQLRLQLRESMARISESIREAMQGKKPQMMVFDCPIQEENAEYFKWHYEGEPLATKSMNILTDALRKLNSSEKANSSTSSKMEQVEDNDYREQLFIKVIKGETCDYCKYRDVVGCDYPCLECKGYDLYEPKDEPQTKRSE